MQRIILLIVAVCTLFVATAQNKIEVRILEQSASGLIIDIKIGSPKLIPTLTPQGLAFKPVLQNATVWQQKGAPDLQKLNVSLAIPATTNTNVTILNTTFTDTLIAISPSKGKIIRPNTPEKMPFSFGSLYSKDVFFPEQIFKVNPPYIFRNARGQALHIAPMQYNAVTKTLRTYSNIRLKIEFNGENNFNALPEVKAENSPVFAEMYKVHFINDLPNLNPLAYSSITDKGSMLVLAPAKFIKHITPLVEWKNQKGIATKLVNIDTISGGVADVNIRAFVKNYYLANANTFVLMVGNAVDVPTVNLFVNDTSLHGPGDNAYGYISGTAPFVNEPDHYPELIVGRLMSRDSNDIKVQVQKIIDYEKTPNMSDNWMRNILGIASSEGTGDDNQYDYEHIRDICDSAVGQFTYLKKIELYDGDRGQADSIGNPVAMNVVNTINQIGTGLINYAGHGDNYFITTTAFSAQTHVPMLSNTTGKLPFMITVGCKPGNFTLGNCLGASGAWAKDNANGKGTGFIASAMSTVDQYWNEPMQAQDEMNAVLRGARPSNIRYTIGGICVNGFAGMNDQYDIATDPTGGSDMTDCWQIFGDPSVELLTKNEGALSCIYETLININATSFIVNSTTQGALATLYYEGKILGSKLIVGGVAVFTIPASTLVLLKNVVVTVTKHNMVPCVGNVLVVNYATGLQNIANTKIELYPNPVTDILQIKATENITEINLCDITGKQILQIPNNSKTASLNMSALSKGIYILQIKNKDAFQNFKISKN